MKTRSLSHNVSKETMQTIFLSSLLLLALHGALAFSPALVVLGRRTSSLSLGNFHEGNSVTRRDTLASFLGTLLVLPTPAIAKCTDIDSCREVGEAKDQQDLQNNPIHHLPNGISYKILDQGVPSSPQTVSPNSSVDIAFSVSQANGRYMYSKGLGLEKVEFMGNMARDRDIDSLRVDLGQRNVPVGIEQVLVGMKKGEKRRIVLPPEVGFDTSDWKPAPVKRDAQRQMEVYRQLLRGNGAQPPFAAPTIWDVEVLRIRA
jgi:hypothetical protein